MFSDHRRIKLEINIKKITKENVFTLSSTFLKSLYKPKRKITMEIGNYIELNIYKNITYQKLWDTLKPF